MSKVIQLTSVLGGAPRKDSAHTPTQPGLPSAIGILLEADILHREERELADRRMDLEVNFISFLTQRLSFHRSVFSDCWVPEPGSAFRTYHEQFPLVGEGDRLQRWGIVDGMLTVHLEWEAMKGTNTHSVSVPVAYLEPDGEVRMQLDAAAMRTRFHSRQAERTATTAAGREAAERRLLAELTARYGPAPEEDVVKASAP